MWLREIAWLADLCQVVQVFVVQTQVLEVQSQVQAAQFRRLRSLINLSLFTIGSKSDHK